MSSSANSASRFKYSQGKRCFIHDNNKFFNHAHADTVQNEAVQILCTPCKKEVTDTACERPSAVFCSRGV